MAVDLQQDFFGLFGLPQAFAVDEAALEQAYRDLQNQVHPDRFAHLSDGEKRLSMQWATRVNEAYQTLRAPLSRASYLLRIHGIDPGFETNTAMSPAFLMEQLAWREEVEEARSSAHVSALEGLHQRLRRDAKAMVADLGAALDARRFDEASDLLRRMMFMEKLQHEIDDALEALET